MEKICVITKRERMHRALDAALDNLGASRIDFGTMSPARNNSVRQEKKRNVAAFKTLFPEGGKELRPVRKPANEKDRLLRMAAELDALAARGMKPQAYKKKAAELRAQAAALHGR